MPRFNTSLIIAACIVAAGLIASALIVAHRPAITGENILPVTTPVAKPMVMPPISQASVQEQFRAQVLAAPALHSFPYNGKRYTLADIKVNQITYAPKEDTFTVTYNYVWQPAMPPSGPQNSLCQLTNDGYSHYHDTAVISTLPDGILQSADITIK